MLNNYLVLIQLFKSYTYKQIALQILSNESVRHIKIKASDKIRQGIANKLLEKGGLFVNLLNII